MITYKILLVLAIVSEFIFVPLFLKAVWPDRNKKSLALKMICSSLFICTGLLAVRISGNTSEFAKLLMIGLAMGWLGDFFLHVSNKTIYFLFGLISFLGGHICYICAFCWAIADNFPEAGFFSPVEISAFIILFGAAVFYSVSKKMKLGAALVPVSLYAAILTVMVIKAGSLGLRMVFACVPNAALLCILLILGALLFVVSDALLAVMMFNDQRNNRSMKIVNIVTYFTAQVLLALTILLIL